MSIRNSFLAILADSPAHGYALKSKFEDSTARVWPLNVGQVYTTVGRLERDGLVEKAGEGDGSRQLWRITAQGRATLQSWYAETATDQPPVRDELSLKLLLAIAADAIDVSELIRSQRAATMQRLQRYTQEKRDVDPEQQFAWSLVLDSLILKTEAEAKWLDHCEEALRQRGRA